MKESKKTFLEFDERSVVLFGDLKKSLKPYGGQEPSNREVFLFAMAVGFANGIFADELKKSGTGVRVQYFKPEDQALMAAVQLGHNDSTATLFDLEERYEIVERYAQGGILLLKDQLTVGAKLGSELAAELRELLPPAEDFKEED